MRGTLDGLAPAQSLGSALPAVYQEDDFTQRFLAGLDVVVAPVFAVIDNIDAYLDPDLAPPDFLTWLATWVGVAPDERWDEARTRAIVGSAVDLYRMRGTAAALQAQIELETGGQVEIIENGATGWSVDAAGELPGSPEPIIVVRVMVTDPRSIDPLRLDGLVARAKPAHVPHRIEVVKAGGKSSGPASTEASAAPKEVAASEPDSGAREGAAGAKKKAPPAASKPAAEDEKEPAADQAESDAPG